VTTGDEVEPLISSSTKESYSSLESASGRSTDEGSPAGLSEPPQTSPSNSEKTEDKKTNGNTNEEKQEDNATDGNTNDENLGDNKPKGTKMDARSTFSVELRIYRSILMHSLAAEYFRCRHFWVFEFQQGLYTMISSILAFVATTDLVDSRTSIILTTIVGATTIFVGFLQAMNSLCSYGTRATLHESVAVDLRDQRNQLRMLRCKLGYMEGNGLTALGTQYSGVEGEKEEYSDGTFESIRSKYEQTLNGCKSAIPLDISEAFNGVESSLYTTAVQSMVELFVHLYGPKFPFEVLGIKQCDVVAEQIMSYPLFPALLPRSRNTVKQSLKGMRKAYKEGWEFYNDIEIA